MDFTNVTNGVGIVAGAIAASGSDQITGTVGAVCAAICAAGYIIKMAAKLARWCLALYRKAKNGATAEELDAHFGELEKIGKEIEDNGKKNP